MLNGQNHKGSSYHIGRQIIDKMSGENEITEFFFRRIWIIFVLDVTMDGVRLQSKRNIGKKKVGLMEMTMEGMIKQGDKQLISLFCNLWYYMTSIRISSIILLFFSLLIVTYVISITTLIRRNIPITKVPHGI